jgi:hypothetical protein
MAAFQDTYVFKQIGLGINLDRIAEINSNLEAAKIKPADLEAITSDIKHKINVYGKEVILDELETGKTIMVYAPRVQLPVWALVDPKGQVISVANVFGAANFTPDKPVNIQQPRKIYTLALMAYVVRKFYEYRKQITQNNQFNTAAGKIYVRFFARILDVLYTVSSSPIQMSGIEFVLGKFFSRYIVERTNLSPDFENNFAHSITSKGRDTTITALIETTKGFTDEDYSSLDKFVAALAREFTLLRQADTNTILRRFISMYGEKSLLMIENYQYFIGYTLSAVYSGSLIKDFAYESTMGNDGAKVAQLYLNIVK